LGFVGDWAACWLCFGVLAACWLCGVGGQVVVWASLVGLGVIGMLAAIMLAC